MAWIEAKFRERGSLTVDVTLYEGTEEEPVPVQQAEIDPMHFSGVAGEVIRLFEIPAGTRIERVEDLTGLCGGRRGT